MENKVKNELLGVIRALCLLPCAKPFLKPVDVVGLCIPDYLEIILKPMDIGTIKKKLMSKAYTSTNEFLEDVYLVFENYPRNPVRILCEDLQTQFEIQWKMYTDRKLNDSEGCKTEEKIPVKREVEYIEVKKVRRAKIKEEDKFSIEHEKELEKEKANLERERLREEKERQREERERLREIREREKEAEREREREREKEREKVKIEEVKVKEKSRRKVEVEYEEELNFDKLTGKDQFESVIKFKVPEVQKIEEPVIEDPKPTARIESIEYMRAALLPLVDLSVRPLLKMNLLNAMFTVAHL